MNRQGFPVVISRVALGLVGVLTTMFVQGNLGEVNRGHSLGERVFKELRRA